MVATRFFILPTLVVALLSAVGCVTEPLSNEDDADFDQSDAPAPRPKQPPVFQSVGVLQAQLGMNRRPNDLGFTDKSFNPCSFGLSEICNNQYLTVVHFQLLCRSTEGTVSAVPRGLKPIVHPQIVWNLAGRSGGTATDRNGYGHFSVISGQPLRGYRLILRKGAQYVGLTVTEVTKLILPKDWCS